MITENIINFKKSWKMALVDLKKLYKGTLLGWFWIIAKPSITIFMYWFVFAVGLRTSVSSSEYSYFIWLITGLLPWFYISEMFTFSTKSFKKYSYLVNKIEYPIGTIPNFINISRLIVHLVLTIIITIIYLIAGGSLDIYFIQLPIIIILTFLFVGSLGMILAILGALSKDFDNMIRIIIQPILFLSPILWDLNNITIPLVILIEKINPINFIVSSYRNIYIYKEWITNDLFSLGAFLITLTITFIIANVLYKNLKKELPDYL